MDRRTNDIKKIVIIGPESTGKTTLCNALATHYQTSCCPEFARQYLEEKGGAYDYEDMLRIAQGQLALEDEYYKKASPPYYFIDTDMHVMKVWSEVVFGTCDPWILKQAAVRAYDHYLLCAIDLAWVPDGLREYPDTEVRQRLFLEYKDILVNSGISWSLVSGAADTRLQVAIAAIEARFG
jgi:NadR type nicotinamide-nucleotide adenylyltransferase